MFEVWVDLILIYLFEESQLQEVESHLNVIYHIDLLANFTVRFIAVVSLMINLNLFELEFIHFNFNSKGGLSHYLLLLYFIIFAHLNFFSFNFS